jgi:hypothetical protein
VRDSRRRACTGQTYTSRQHVDDVPKNASGTEEISSLVEAWFARQGALKVMWQIMAMCKVIVASDSKSFPNLVMARVITGLRYTSWGIGIETTVTDPGLHDTVAILTLHSTTHTRMQIVTTIGSHSGDLVPNEKGWRATYIGKTARLGHK